MAYDWTAKLALIDSALPDSAEQLFRAALMGVLRDDPALSAAGVAIRGWEGATGIGSDPAKDPHPDEIPCITVMTGGGESSKDTVRSHTTSIVYAIIIHAPTLNYRYTSNIWNGFLGAIWPQDGNFQPVQDRLRTPRRLQMAASLVFPPPEAFGPDAIAIRTVGALRVTLTPRT